MKSVISLALVVALTTSAMPIAAQEWVDPDAGPIHRAIASVAFQLAVEDVASSVRHAAPGGGSVRSDWSHVQQLRSGSEIILTIRGSRPSRRYLVTADGSGLTVLNLTNPAIPNELTEGLQDRARGHPDDILAVERGVTLRLSQGQLSTAGLFSGVRQIAGLEEVVERIAQSDVAEIVLREKAMRRHMARGALIGAGVGFTFVYLEQASFCRQHPCSGDDSPVGWALGIGIPFGAGIGTGVGAALGAVLPPSQNLIYRAP